MLNAKNCMHAEALGSTWKHREAHGRTWKNEEAFFSLAVQKSVALFEGGGRGVRKSHSMDSLLLSKIRRGNKTTALWFLCLALFFVYFVLFTFDKKLR
jgi:hypothetical protein